jgi:hypothetical protein
MEEHKIRFKAKYNSAFGVKVYDVKGVIYDINESINVELGVNGKNHCIFLTYYKTDNTVYLGTITVYGWSKDKSDDLVFGKLKCFENNPDFNMDVLVMLSLAFIRKYIGKKTLSISDLAGKDNASLSWLKFFNSPSGAKSITYSKFGFQLTSPDEKNHFQEIMKDIEEGIKQKMPGKNITYEEYLQGLMKHRDDSTIIHEYFDIDKKVNVMKIWYMDWKIYDAIPNKVRIYDLKF